MNKLFLFNYKDFDFTLSAVMTERRVFVVDTYMGPNSIKDVRELCEKNSKGRAIYAINTHSHFDHIWGNSAFSHREIIAHSKCREFILKEGEKTLREISEKNPEWIKEPVEIVLPTMTFEEEMIFYDKDSTVKIKYLPGHTEDSSVVILEPEKILLAGDMVEDPFPLLEGKNIDLYLKNLRWLKEQNFSRVIPCHGKRQDPKLIEDNMSYIKNLKRNIIRLLKKNKKIDHTTLPIKGLVEEESVITPFYSESHKNNIKSALEFVDNKGQLTYAGKAG